MSLYFIAITAPGAIDRDVLGFKQFMQERFGCRVALKSPAHITLIPPFELRTAVRSSLLETLDHFARTHSPFHLTLKNFAAFKPRVIYVDVLTSDPLQQVQQALERAMLAAGMPIKRSNRPFHPHVTIANRDLLQEDFPAAWQHFRELAYTATFEARSIALLELIQGRWATVHAAPFTENPVPDAG